jgi:hypothetical protein
MVSFVSVGIKNVPHERDDIHLIDCKITHRVCCTLLPYFDLTGGVKHR